MDEIIIQKQEQYIPTVEIRNAKDVLYLTEKEILYCKNKRTSHKITIHLTNGTTVETENFITNFFTELFPFGTFFIANKNTIVNARYMKKAGLFRITMQNGTSFRRKLTKLAEIKKIKENVK